MTKQEYLSELEQALSVFPSDFTRDILNDYEEHFKMGLQHGKTEEQICTELGDVRAFVQELKDASPDLSACSFVPAANNPFFREAADSAPHTDSGASECSGYSCTCLHADLPAAEITVCSSADSLVHVHYRENSSLDHKLLSRFVCTQEGNTLFLHMEKLPPAQEEQRGFFGFVSRLVSVSHCDSSVLIELPEGFEELCLHTASADIFAESLRLQNMSVKSSSGDIVLKHLAARQLSAENASGSFELQHCRIDTVRGKLLSGDFTIHDTSINQLHFSTASGNVEGMHNRLGRVQLSTASGDIDLTGLFRNASFQTASGDVEIGLSGSDGLNASIQTISGDVDVDYRDLSYHISDVLHTPLHLCTGDAPARIEIKTVSGSVSVLET